jgi:hypothetical protein
MSLCQSNEDIPFLVANFPLSDPLLYSGSPELDVQSTSNTVHKSIEKNPRKLLEYHNQLDKIRSRWNVDPVNVIADKINNLKIPANVIMKLVIGDFGCGKCRLADLLKENKVYCFDHNNICTYCLSVIRIATNYIRSCVT